jgi:hypothetical protein
MHTNITNMFEVEFRIEIQLGAANSSEIAAEYDRFNRVHAVLIFLNAFCSFFNSSQSQIKMFSLSTQRAIFWSTLCCSAMFNAVVLFMKASSMHFRQGGGMNAEFSIYPNTSDPTTDRRLGWLPLTMFPIEPNYTLIVATVALVINISGALAAFIAWYKDIRVRRMPTELCEEYQHSYQFYNLKIAHLLKWALTLIPFFLFVSTVLSFSQHKLSSHFNVNYVSKFWGSYGPDRNYEQGIFDLETWVCDIAVYDNVSPVGSVGFGAACTVELAARWLLLPWLTISSIVASLSWWLIYEETKSVVRSQLVKSIMRMEIV